MKALVLNQDQSLTFTTVEQPKIGEHDVLVKVHASALNHRELWIQQGLYPGMKLPCILGADGSGIVVEVGKGVDASWLDKSVIVYPGLDWGSQEQAPSRQFRVLGMPDPGTMAEYISVPKDCLVVKPEYLSFAEAAAIPVASLTAWRALVRHGGISAKSKVLITGIGGGVSQAGLAIALAYGAEVYVTSSSQQKIDKAVELGAKAGVNYRDEDWNLQLRSLTKGIDIVLDSSPAPSLDGYLKFMNYGGRIVAYGSTGSPKTTISISKFFLRHIQFIGTAMGSPREFADLLAFYDKYKIRPIIDSEYSLDQASDAMQALSTGKQVGKIVLSHT